MTVNTKEAERRSLSYPSFEALLADLDSVESAQAGGTLRTSGNWSPGQVMKHSSILIACALDGFPGKPAPWLVRKLLVTLYKKKALSGAPMPAGFKIPKQADFLDPGDPSFEEGLAALRGVAERVTGGAQMTHPSPVFEKLSHDEWVILTLGHTSLHMSFLHPGGDA